MRVSRLGCVALASASVGLGGLACNQRPLQPSSVTLVGLNVIAPDTVALNESLTLSAKAVKPDGSTTDVTGQTLWSSSPPTVLEVTAAGVASGRIAGQAVVTGSYGGLSATATIIVVPRGTFYLTGRVLKDDVGVAGAVVTVTSGIGQGLTSRTDGNGRYDLYGVGGLVELDVTRDGDLVGVERTDVTSHRSLNVVLAPPPPPGTDYSGLYTMVLDAGRCTGTFPEVAKHRVYTALVGQTGSALRVSLSGADIWRGSGVFEGTIHSTGDVKFTIRPAWWWDYEAFDLIENIGNGMSVIVQGNILASRIAQGIIGRQNPNSNDEAALGIRLNQTLGGWCTIERFQLLPK